MKRYQIWLLMIDDSESLDKLLHTVPYEHQFLGNYITREAAEADFVEYTQRLWCKAEQCRKR